MSRQVTVKDLRNAIDGLDENAPVVFLMQSGCCGDYEELEHWHYSRKAIDFGHLTIYFDALPGYETCRDAADTRKRSEDVQK